MPDPSPSPSPDPGGGPPDPGDPQRQQGFQEGREAGVTQGRDEERGKRLIWVFFSFLFGILVCYLILRLLGES